MEIRVTVVDERVFAAEIHSQVPRPTQHDWRRYDPFSTPVHPHPLPAAEAERCARLLRRLGLRYGAIDLVLTPEGQYVFLELNSNGQYLWVERRTRLPISEAIAELLRRGESTEGKLS
jgi:glutathione synthase/RimK-type ligase-like ATP-grasp enzyme